MMELFKGKKGILFAVPGAFTPGCSKVWVYGVMRMWKYECMELWVYESMNVWSFEYMKVWMYRVVSIWKYECMELWVYESVELWSMDMWGMDIWIYYIIRNQNIKFPNFHPDPFTWICRRFWEIDGILYITFHY